MIDEEAQAFGQAVIRMLGNANNRTYRVTLDIEISPDRGIPPVFRLVDSKIVRDEFDPPRTE